MEIRRTTILGLALLLAGIVLCGLDLRLLLEPAQYKATVVIKLEREMADIMGLGSPPRDAPVYDPYFIQTEFEVLQSQLVLSNVVSALNLNVKWGMKCNNGVPLKTLAAVALLKRRMDLRPVRKTKLISISVFSEDPDEAADIANAIARAFQDERLKIRNQMIQKGIQALREQLQRDEEYTRMMQTNLDLLRKKYQINSADETDFDSDTNWNAILKGWTPSEREEQIKQKQRTGPFWDEKQKLRRIMDFHKPLAAKIESETLNLQTPVTSPVQIVDAAQPPKSPVDPDRPLGAALLVIGLFPTVGGWLLLKSSCRLSSAS